MIDTIHGGVYLGGGSPLHLFFFFNKVQVIKLSREINLH